MVKVHTLRRRRHLIAHMLPGTGRLVVASLKQSPVVCIHPLFIESQNG